MKGDLEKRPAPAGRPTETTDISAPSAYLNPGERLDDLCHLGRRLIQRADAYRFAMDAVLLAHFPHWRSRDRVLDLGTGTGAIPLLMAEETAHVDGIEIDETLADMASRSVSLNGLEKQITVRRGDYRSIESFYPAGHFDVVVANPPYYPLGQGKLNAEKNASQARHELTATLADVVRAANYALGSRGRLAMVHLPERLDEIILALRKNDFSLRRGRLVQPRVDKPPNLVLIEAAIGCKPGHVKWLPTLNVYDMNGTYTPDLLAIYDQTTGNDPAAAKPDIIPEQKG